MPRGRKAASSPPTTYVLPVEIVPDGDGFMALVPSLPGCVASGSTRDEAVGHLQEAARAYIDVALHFGDPLPENVHVVHGGVAVTV